MAYDPNKGLNNYKVKKKGHSKLKTIGTIAITALVTKTIVSRGTKESKDGNDKESK